MKYWRMMNNEIQMKGEEKYEHGRILNIIKENDKFIFIEGCDDNFKIELSKNDAIELLKEAIIFIKEE